MVELFRNEFASDPSKIVKTMRERYAGLPALAGIMHSAFAQFSSIRQDAEDNMASMPMKLTMTVLAVGSEEFSDVNKAIVMRNVAVNVNELEMPNSGVWLMEEQLAATIAATRLSTPPSERQPGQHCQIEPRLEDEHAASSEQGCPHHRRLGDRCAPMSVIGTMPPSQRNCFSSKTEGKADLMRSGADYSW